MAVQEIAAIPVRTAAFFEKHHAFLGLVQTILLVVLPEFVGTVRELALIAVGTIPELDVLFAQLKFFFQQERGPLRCSLAAPWGIRGVGGGGVEVAGFLESGNSRLISMVSNHY